MSSLKTKTNKQTKQHKNRFPDTEKKGVAAREKGDEGEGKIDEGD